MLQAFLDKSQEEGKHLEYWLTERQFELLMESQLETQYVGYVLNLGLNLCLRSEMYLI